jgi:hypothetical protein
MCGRRSRLGGLELPTPSFLPVAAAACVASVADMVVLLVGVRRNARVVRIAALVHWLLPSRHANLQTTSITRVQ